MARARDLVRVCVDNLILIEEGAVKQVSFSMTILYIICLLYVFVQELLFMWCVPSGTLDGI